MVVFPELALVVSSISAAWVLELLTKYPTPEKIAHTHTASLEKLPYVTPERARQVQEAARRSVASLRGDVAGTLVGKRSGDRFVRILDFDV